MNNFERVKDLVDKYVSENGKDTEMSRGEFLEWVNHTYPNISAAKNNLYPTDISYNLYNKGLTDFPGPNLCLVYVEEHDAFKLVGSGYSYSGPIIQYKGKANERIVGHWIDGECRMDEVNSSEGDLPDDVLMIRKNLEEGICRALKGIPVDVVSDKRTISITFQDELICGVRIDEDTYQIFNVSYEWSQQTTYRCEQFGDGTWFYYLETIDECISQVKRLVLFEAKKGSKNAVINISYETQLSKVGLDVKDNWKGDPRNRFEKLFNPLINGSEYYFQINTTDTSSKILELYRKGESKRVMGVSGKQNMTINAFFNPDFYRFLKQSVNLPENEKAYRSQPHMNISLEQLWNVMCVATGNKEYMRY